MPDRESPRIHLPLELAEACERAGLRVLRAPFESARVVLSDRVAGGHYLLVADELPAERVEGIVRQSLADVGARGFENVPIEPFGYPPGFEHLQAVENAFSDAAAAPGDREGQEGRHA